ncbi:MAG TPA: L-threonylcarbamoyladenylate synthase [Anaerolineae bacterium]
MTQLYKLDASPAVIEHAGQVIRAGGLVAFPTETVYGLGADATNAEAVAKIFAAKQRALNDPLIVHCAPPADADMPTVGESERLGNRAPIVLQALLRDEVIGALTNTQRRRANAMIGSFWPGPLTLVLPRGARIPRNATAGLDTVAVRMPAHPAALALILSSGVPIAAPSANRFGHVSPTLAQHVLDDLDGLIDMVLDGGPTRIGVESTVLDLITDVPVILRPGGLARAAIESAVGHLGARNDEPGSHSAAEAQPAPGMLTKHYAPRARLEVATDTDQLRRLFTEYTARGQHPGLLLTTDQQASFAGCGPQYVMGADIEAVARKLYAGMRALDSDGVDIILISAVDGVGIGEAVADRLRRGSSGGV